MLDYTIIPYFGLLFLGSLGFTWVHSGALGFTQVH